jgi:hypothetical protein
MVNWSALSLAQRAGLPSRGTGGHGSVLETLDYGLVETLEIVAPYALSTLNSEAHPGMNSALKTAGWGQRGSNCCFLYESRLEFSHATRRDVR